MYTKRSRPAAEFKRACYEHQSRCERLNSVREELERVATAIHNSEKLSVIFVEPDIRGE